MYEWDEKKRLSNIEKHSIDFAHAIKIWRGFVLENHSNQPQHGEQRTIAVGMLEEVCIAVIYTQRNEVKRLISARKARKYERENYQNAAG